MIISYLNRHEIATISYPLMDPNIQFSGSSDCLDLNHSHPKNNTASLYIHIPFCEKICSFCIYKREIPGKNKEMVQEYVNALIKEMRMYGESNYIKNIKVAAIFFGGGSPSCLTVEQVELILNEIKKNIPCKSDVEISFECSHRNSEDTKIKALKALGITRLSSGVQTFNDTHRKRLGLDINSQQVVEWLAMAKSCSFRDVSIDLIYGLPGQTVKEALEDLQLAVSLGITHISRYKLAVFGNSQLYKDLNDHRIPALPDKDMIFEMYRGGDDYLLNNGFYSQTVDEYSVMNKKVLFWDMVNDGLRDNIVLGCSSLGYINGYSYQNKEDIKEYIEAVNNGLLPIKMVSKKATTEQLRERFCLINLRRNVIHKKDFENYFNDKIENHFGELLEDLLDKKFIVEDDNRYVLTQLGKYYQGNISINFMQSSFRKASPYRRKLAIGMHIHPDSL